MESIVISGLIVSAVDRKLHQVKELLRILQHIGICLCHDLWIIAESTAAEGTQYENVHVISRGDGKDLPGTLFMDAL